MHLIYETKGGFFSESAMSTPSQFGPVSLFILSKNDDEEHCFLK